MAVLRNTCHGCTAESYQKGTERVKIFVSEGSTPSATGGKRDNSKVSSGPASVQFMKRRVGEGVMPSRRPRTGGFETRPYIWERENG
jgi:hypothetical protein